MAEPTLSAFVERARAAFDEYCRLRFLGVSHGMALHRSGFYDAIVKPDEEKLAFDVKQAQTGDRD